MRSGLEGHSREFLRGRLDAFLAVERDEFHRRHFGLWRDHKCGFCQIEREERLDSVCDVI